MMLAMMIAEKFPLLLQAVPANPGAMTPEQFQQQVELESIRHRGMGPGGFGILIPIAFFGMIWLFAWLGMKRRRAEIQARADFHKQLLDKFGSGREFAEFLESKGSQRFLEELWAQAGPRNRMLSGLHPGIVLATLGLGFLGLSVLRHPLRDASVFPNLVVPGVIILSLGIGFLLSALVAHRLSKKPNAPGGSDSGGATLSRT
jgi:hypothetical protein